MVFSEIIAVVNLWDRLKSIFSSEENKPNDTVASRFMMIFEEHGVHRNQIPRFFGHGLEVADFVSEKAVVNKLSENIMQDACELFCIRREWLDGADDVIHQTYNFYKSPGDFVEFLENLKNNNVSERSISGLLLAPTSRQHSTDSVLVIRECIGEVGDREIYRNYICSGWGSIYWKGRAYLTACIAIMGKYKYYVRGRYVKFEPLTSLSDGESFFDIENSEFLGSGWQPEDMMYRPDMYLKDVDPEMNNYGRISAITKWLELAEKGYMDSYFPARISVFQDELAKQKANG